MTGMGADNWFEAWTRSLLEERRSKVAGDTPFETFGNEWAADAARARFRSGFVDSLNVGDVLRDIQGEVDSTGLEPEAEFYTMQTSAWIAGVMIGSRDGFHSWVLDGWKPKDPGVESCRLLRAALAMMSERTPFESSRRFITDPARQVPRSADVARMNAIRERTLHTARTRNPPAVELPFIGSIMKIAGGYHEGAWMTIGVLAEHPPELKGTDRPAP